MSNDSPLPDLRERVQSMVGRLSVLSSKLAAGMPLPASVVCAETDDAMALLAALEPVVAHEADLPRSGLGVEALAHQLEVMADVGPRSPSSRRLLQLAAGQLRTAAAAHQEASTLEVRPAEPVMVTSPGVTIVCHGPVTVNLPPRGPEAFS